MVLFIIFVKKSIKKIFFVRITGVKDSKYLIFNLLNCFKIRIYQWGINQNLDTTIIINIYIYIIFCKSTVILSVMIL